MRDSLKNAELRQASSPVPVAEDGTPSEPVIGLMTMVHDNFICA
jgi:hypothetical protein